MISLLTGPAGRLGAGLRGYLDSRSLILGQRGVFGRKGLLKLGQPLLPGKQRLLAHLQIPPADEPAVSDSPGAVQIFLCGLNQCALGADLCLKLGYLSDVARALRGQLRVLCLIRCLRCVRLCDKTGVLLGDGGLNKRSWGLRGSTVLFCPDRREFSTGGNHLSVVYGQGDYDAKPTWNYS